MTDVFTEYATAEIPNKIITIRPEEPVWINCYIKRQIRQRKMLFNKSQSVPSRAEITFKKRNMGHTSKLQLFKPHQ